MEYVKLSNVLGEAATRLDQVRDLLEAYGLTTEAAAVAQLSVSFLEDACQDDLSQAKGAGLLWQEAPIAGSTAFVEGKRYHTWGGAVEAATMAGEGWRLPTPEELRRLYEEDPESPVFQPNGRHGSREPWKADGIGSTVALWTSEEDSRDFAVECVVTEEFGLTSHPALKRNHITAWLVKEL